MSVDKKLNAVEILDEAMEYVNGGLMNDDRSPVNNETEDQGYQTKELRITNIKSPIATGERIASVPQAALTGTESAKKRLPKIVFAKKGKSV